ncbi:unnamed protein product [Urochloa humidicola]
MRARDPFTPRQHVAVRHRGLHLPKLRLLRIGCGEWLTMRAPSSSLRSCVFSTGSIRQVTVSPMASLAISLLLEALIRVAK